MSRYRRPADLANEIHIHSTFTATYINPTLIALNDNAGGYAESTPGASPAEAQGSSECPQQECTNTRPCELHGDDVKLTTTERNAGHSDKAQRDLDRLNELLRKQAPIAEEVAAICRRWGPPGVDKTTIASAIQAIDFDTFRKKEKCAHCPRPHLEGRTECAWCRDFRLEWAYPPPQQVIELRERRRELRHQDITPWMDRLHPDWRKKAKKANKGKVA